MGEKKGREGANKSVGVVRSLLKGSWVDAVTFVGFGVGSQVGLGGGEGCASRREPDSGRVILVNVSVARDELWLFACAVTCQ
jgi:hypothetical protein